MKNSSNIVTLSLLPLLLFLGVAACNPGPSVSENILSAPAERESAMTSESPISGGWYLISGEYFGNKRDDGKPFQFKLAY